MCLDRIKIKKNFLDRILKNTITVYKIVQKVENIYTPVFRTRYRYKPGLIFAEIKKVQFTDYEKKSYNSGFHFFYEHKDATIMKSFYEDCCKGSIFEIIECQIKKEWVTAVGTENHKNIDRIVIVTDKAIILPDTK